MTEEPFQLTRLMRGVTGLFLLRLRSTCKFQLTRLMRGVTKKFEQNVNGFTFQLTRLMRGVTSPDFDKITEYLDFNSHASCEA